jgi:hypothetical protein
LALDADVEDVFATEQKQRQLRLTPLLHHLTRNPLQVRLLEQDGQPVEA